MTQVDYRAIGVTVALIAVMVLAVLGILVALGIVIRDFIRELRRRSNRRDDPETWLQTWHPR